MQNPRRSRIFGVAFVLLLAYLLWRIFRPFLEPIAWAAVLALILHPVFSAIRRRIKRKNAAALAATILTFLVVAGPGAFLALTFVSQGRRLYSLASAYFANHHVSSASDLMNAPFLRSLSERVGGVLPLTTAEIQEWILGAVKSLGDSAGSLASQAALGALRFVFLFAIMLFTLFFFFRDGESIWSRLVASLPVEPDRSGPLIERLHSVFRAVVLGTLLTAILQGLLGGLGFAIFGLPSPVVFAALMALLSLLPVGGTAIVWAPAAVILAAQGCWGRAIGLAVWGIVIVGLADNWFKPMIISGRSKMNTLPVFFGVMGGLAAFGFLGLFVGPMVICLALALWESAENGAEPE